MPDRAIFGEPVGKLTAGGALITTHVVPVFEGSLVVFDLDSGPVGGRWLPWTTMAYAENPYVTASSVVDEWCQGAIRELRLVDVLSTQPETGVWELSIVFRAELSASPAEMPQRKPRLIDPAQAGKIGPFDQVDLQRWVGVAAEAEPSEKLLF